MQRLEFEAESERRRAGEERQRTELERRDMAAEQSAVVSVVDQGLDRLTRGDFRRLIEKAFMPEYERLRTDFNVGVLRLQAARLFGFVSQFEIEPLASDRDERG